MKKLIYTLIALFSVLMAYPQSGSLPKFDKVFQRLLFDKDSINSNALYYQKTLISIPSPYKSDLYIKPNSNNFDGILFKAIIYSTDAQVLKRQGIAVQSVYPNFCTALLSINDLEVLSILPEVKFVEAPKSDSVYNDVAVGSTGAALLHAGRLGNISYKGKNVLVGIFDTGIDWDHPDFRSATDQTKSRILRMWDQTLTKTGAEVSPSGFTYGVEYTQTHLNNELDGSPAGFVREQDSHGHGTHVAGTAAGNGMALPSKKYSGMAPEADLVVVKGGNGSFSETNIIDGLTYFRNVATALGKPIVVNMSIGGLYGAHDGTRNHELAVDNFTNSGPGRVVCISAGNDDGSNKHIQNIVAAGSSGTITFNVANSTTASDLFAFRAYVNGNNTFSVTATPPSGSTVTAGPGQIATGNVVTNAFTISLENNIDPSNGKRFFEIYVYRNGTNSTDGVGAWTLTLNNTSATSATVNGWLYYFNAGATTTITGGDNNYMVASPGNATTAITVGAFAGKIGWYSNGTSPGGYKYVAPALQDAKATFSSIGPRADGFQKPDITATGQAVISCLATGTLGSGSSSIVDPTYYRVNQGTSMSSPVVAGAVALLLELNPQATSANIKTNITTTANSDGITGAVPNYSWGHGRLDVFKAAAKMKQCNSTSTRETIMYESNYNASDVGVSVTSGEVGVRFTPSTTGKLGGFFLHTSTTAAALNIQVRAANQSTILGTLAIPASNVEKFAWQYFDLSSLNINITSGTDFYIMVSSPSTWSIRYDNSSIDSRSYTAASVGGALTQLTTLDYRIRSVVYNVATATNSGISANYVTDRRDVAEQFFQNGCSLIAKIVSGGASPISGITNATIWVDANQSSNFVKRHYEITPDNNAATSTGRITLYFSQSEFDNFNTLNSDKLPTGPSDAAGIARMKVEKRSATSLNGSGLPSSYTGSITTIDASTIGSNWNVLWNTTSSRWEVSFDVVGFSGFWLKTQIEPLPLQWLSFSGKLDAAKHAELHWKVKEENVIRYRIERSKNGILYEPIGTLTSKGDGTNEYNFTDIEPLEGVWMYRILQEDIDGKSFYSKTISLRNEKSQSLACWPNPAKEILTVNSPTAQSVVISNGMGQILQKLQIKPGNNEINVENLNPGIYFINSTGVSAIRFIKQ